MGVELPTTYTYKAYSGSTYLGLLDGVISTPDYGQVINSSGAQIPIVLQSAFPDVDAEAVTINLVDEAGNRIVDEVGNRIIVSRTYVFNNVPINLANRIIVTEFSNNHPNGITYFDGFIFDWTANYKANTITINVVSHGVRLDNYILDPSRDTTTSQRVYNSEIVMQPASSKPTTDPDLFAQTFQAGASTLLASVKVYMRKDGAGAAPTGIALIEGTPLAPGAFLAAVGLSDLDGTSVAVATYTFSTPISITALTNYHFRLENQGLDTSGYSYPYIEYQNSSVYSAGQMYKNIGGAGWSAMSADMAFELISTTGSVQAVYTSIDPSQIARTGIDAFNDKGGLVTYDANSIDDTGSAVSYTFLLATILETVKKGYDLSPSTWWWYVNVATNLLHLHDTSQTADHTFTLGNHLDDLTISQSLSTLKNIIYFSGGDTGSGNNLFRINKDDSSINHYGQWLDRLSDNRVTDPDTADLFSLARLGKFSTPPFNIMAIIPSRTYDISLITVGQTVSFNNFNNLIDTLLLQIVELRRHPDSAELVLGIPQVRNSKLIDDMQRRLTALETVNNPNVVT